MVGKKTVKKQTKSNETVKNTTPSKTVGIGWQQSMSVGEKTIDMQHQKLFNELQRLNTIIQSSEFNMGSLRDSIHFLYGYIQEHFTYEEHYMAEHNYPGLEKHKQIHQSFVSFYDTFQLELREQLKKKDFSLIELKQLLMKIKNHLSDWLHLHIMSEDQKYAKYIASH
jgi:hemerythrin